jgi:TRAP transporter 4TM/12TM fusion protein
VYQPQDLRTHLLENEMSNSADTVGLGPKATSPAGRETPTWLSLCLAGTAMVMIVFHLLTIWFPVFSPILFQNIHLGFAITVVLLAAIRQSRSRIWAVYLILIAIGLAVVIYIHINVDRLDMFAGFPEGLDVGVGIVLVLMVVFLTIQIWGSVFPVLLGLSVLYALFGHLIPGALGHAYRSPGLVLSDLGIGLSGIYGMMLNASANLIFLFIIFGSVFEAVRIDKFFLEIGYFLGKRLRGGAAQTAVFSSAFVGMCTGGAAANVALTGSYTIPLMKNTGFKPQHAGAIEAVASTGGQMTPPIMGVAVFLMASFLGISYGELMLKAVIPMVFFYFFVFLGVIVIATRERIPMLTQPVNHSVLVRGAPLFIIPMGLVTALLILRYTPAYAAAVALLVLLLISMLRKETRPTLKSVLAGFTKGTVMASGIAVACACIGMFMTMLTSTGAGPKLAGMIQVLANGNLLLALVLTMVLSILLGCAMPTAVAYIITALVVSPALVDMGMDMLTAHFFVFYFAILSAVTPPVAAASIVGSRLAETSYLKTGWESLKLVLPFFIVPYFLARNPIILLQGGEPLLDAIGAFTGLFIAGLGLMVFAQKHFLVKLTLIERLLFLLAAILSAGYGQFGTGFALMIAVVLTIALTGRQVVLKRRDRPVGSAAMEST